MRNPNGYGGVIKLSGNRRKPYCARITSGWKDDGKQIFRPIGYFKTSQEAYVALADYHKNPYSLDAISVTFEEIYEKWSASKFDKVSRSSVLGYEAAYKACPDLHKMKFVEIKKNHMQRYIDDPDIGHASKRKLLVLFNALSNFALENDIVSKAYSEFLEMPKNTNKSTRKPFTLDEIAILFENFERMEYIDTILILIFTGLRIGELLDIKISDVDLSERFMMGGNKTEASKERLIPINSKILPLITNWFNMGGEYLIKNPSGDKMSYFTFYDVYWKNIMEKLDMDHKPHKYVEYRAVYGPYQAFP